MTLAELQALEAEHVVPSYARFPVEFVRGAGSRLWDADGVEYLDFLAGISVSSAGHCHPEVVRAVQEQAARLMHVTNLYYTEPAMRLARRLAERSLGGKRMHPTLPLHRLEQDRRRAVVHGSGDRVRGWGDRHEARYERRERRLL